MDKITNRDIRKKMSVQRPLIERIGQKQLLWYRHIRRMLIADYHKKFGNVKKEIYVKMTACIEDDEMVVNAPLYIKIFIVKNH